jgi:hypothetical protein
MDVTEIMDSIKSLPMFEKKDLAYKVIREIDRIEKMEGVTQRWDTVLFTAIRVTGLPYITGSRDAKTVLVREIAAWRMMDEGYYISDIGRAMGKDHSTVSYYARMRKDAVAIPMAFREHLTMYGKLVLALNDND